MSRIKKLFAQNDLAKRINFILLNNHQAENVISAFDNYSTITNNKKIKEDFEKILKRTRAHLFIYGTIKERLEGENKYYLNLEAFIRHTSNRPEIIEEVAKDFSSVWDRQISFKESMEFRGFLFAADSIFIAAQYIIGIAALVSRDIFLALELHTKLDTDPVFLQQISSRSELRPVQVKLKTLRATEHFLLSKYYSEQKKDFAQAESHINKSLSVLETYAGYLTKSFLDFVYRNNPKESFANILKAERLSNNNEGTWRYNKGFLLMYMERFEEALQIYNTITHTGYLDENKVLLNIYSFNQKFLNEHPQFIQSYFIVGFLKYKKESNGPDALEYLERFVSESANNIKYHKLRDMADDYCKEIKHTLGI